MEMQELEKVEKKEVTNELDNTVQEGLVVNIGEKQNKFLESTFVTC